jgi:hypothetical protein
LSKSERDAAYLKNRRFRGLCAVGGCPEHSGDDFYCPPHRLEKTEAMQRWREARRKERGCPNQP